MGYTNTSILFYENNCQGTVDKDQIEPTTSANEYADKLSLCGDYVAESAKGGDFNSLPKGYYYSINFLGTLTAIVLACHGGYIGFNLPANVLGFINEDLGPSSNIVWVALSWTLSGSIGYILVGRLSGIFGRRHVVIGFNVCGLIGNIIAATATQVNTLIAANIFIGLAAAGQLSFLALVIGELVPNKIRGPVNSIIFFTATPWSVFGPVIMRSWILHTKVGYKWAYYTGIIICALVVILLSVYYWPPTYDHLHVHGKAKRKQIMSLDYIGIILFSAGMVMFLIGLSWGGTLYPWNSAHVIAMIVVGFCTLVAFESKTTLEYPLIPMKHFKVLAFLAIIVDACGGSFVYISMVVIWPSIITALCTTDFMEIGWLSCAVGGGLVIGITSGGFTMRYLPRYKIQAIVCATLLLAFVGALASISQHNKAQTVVLLTLGSMASGWFDITPISVIPYILDPKDMGLALGVLGSARSLVGTIATALFSTISQNKILSNLPIYVGPAAVAAGYPDSPASLKALFGGIALGSLDGIRISYAKAFSIVFYITIPFSVCVIISAICTPNIEQYLNNNVARRFVAGFVPDAKKAELPDRGVELEPPKTEEV